MPLGKFMVESICVDNLRKIIAEWDDHFKDDLGAHEAECCVGELLEEIKAILPEAAFAREGYDPVHGFSPRPK